MSSIGSLAIILISVFDTLVLGSPMFFGIFIFGIFGFMSLKAELPTSGWFVWIFPTIIILVSGNKLPLWTKPMALILYGSIFALGWIYIISRR